MKKRKILFISPDYLGLNEVIYEGLEKYSKASVTMALSDTIRPFKYKNLLQRFKNMCSKIFLNKNIKHNYKENIFWLEVNRYKNYDITIVNRPDLFNQEKIDYIKNISGRMIVFFWDSFEKLPGQKEKMHHFDECFSFDLHDCATYGLRKNNNFYFSEEIIENPKYNCFFFGTFDKRFPDLKIILDYLNQEKQQAANAILFNPLRTFDKKTLNCPAVDVIHDMIPFKETYQYSQNTKIIIDLAHPNQAGLSFRAFEAMALRKKIITTNKHIIEYDFYNPNNIAIVDVDNIYISDDFFTTPYQEIDIELYKKYSLESWINNLLS